MARILVTGPATIAAREVQRRLLERMRHDGHEALALGADPDLLDAIRTTDALVVLLDGPADAAAGAAVAYARTQHKPVLGLHPTDLTLPRLLRDLLADHHGADTIDGWLDALPAFYERIRPFAGRLVRDLIPQLVKDAGHDVSFRALTDDEKPRFLKAKVLEEARQLRDSDAGAEKEEIADVLEALETLIRARGYDREALKQVKDAKRKRRGGFDRAWVVETTAAPHDATPRPGAEEADAPPQFTL